MSILINNNLIWVSVPRCASTSIENALLNSNLNIIHYKYDRDKNYLRHYHITKSLLQTKFGNKETICINRNYFDRWLSSLREVWSTYEQFNIKLKVNWEDLNNENIYEIFTDDYINAINLFNFNQFDINSHKQKTMVKLESISYLENNKNFFPESLLRSQLYFKDNSKCTYEFDITELNKFSDLIYDKFGEKLNINKLNETKKIPNKIIIDDKLKQWVWDKFEKPFAKRNILI